MLQKNPLATHKNNADKTRDFITDRRNGVVAHRADGTTVPLCDVKIEDVEFIGGLWRVQTRVDYDLFTIRDRRFIMGPRIDLTERNYFEYYKIAPAPMYNCYGPIFALTYDMVAARYVTDTREYWSYGKTVADARAFLGIALYDEYMDLIHAAACRNTKNKTK